MGKICNYKLFDFESNEEDLSNYVIRKKDVFIF